MWIIIIHSANELQGVEKASGLRLRYGRFRRGSQQRAWTKIRWSNSTGGTFPPMLAATVVFTRSTAWLSAPPRIVGNGCATQKVAKT
jgi:hypothetical protein